MVIEGIKGQWDEMFTDEAMDTRELDQHTAKANFPTIQGYIKQQVENDYTRFQSEEMLLELRGDNFFGCPYKIKGRIEKINYNAIMLLLRKEDGRYALIDFMMVREIHTNEESEKGAEYNEAK